jgi:hypothetical protein
MSASNCSGAGPGAIPLVFLVGFLVSLIVSSTLVLTNNPPDCDAKGTDMGNACCCVFLPIVSSVVLVTNAVLGVQIAASCPSNPAWVFALLPVAACLSSLALGARMRFPR